MGKAKIHYRRWLIQAPLGLVLIGMGLCFAIECAFLKHGGANTWDWVGMGTGALVVFNAGISIFGDAILQRVRYEHLVEKVK